VVERLQAEGVQVTAPANPLRGISIDSAYINSLLDQIPGPVLAVGHSYGGAVITNAATNANNVVGLVYVAAFAPDEGERLAEIENDSKDSVLNTALMPLQYPTGEGQETAVEFAIDPQKFHDAFAADLPAEQTATRRPIAELAFSEPSGEPAWKKLPSWAVVASGDKAAGADAVRSMAERAGAEITEADGSHVIMVSQPQVVSQRPLRIFTREPTADFSVIDPYRMMHTGGSAEKSTRPILHGVHGSMSAQPSVEGEVLRIPYAGLCTNLQLGTASSHFSRHSRRADDNKIQGAE
jgi:pimeloyl-ACP methyl ester carboxylesterase